ncbi:MAG: hypothetical protein NTX17_10565 [Candidatus Eisenbacteria bacterium]|nr:hypothetical protein [Candidatus Eisenbacteria bacterium]
MSKALNNKPREHDQPAMLVFGLDEPTSEQLRSRLRAVVAADLELEVQSRYIAPYVGDFAGFCLSVASSVIGSVMHSIGLRLLRRARAAKKGHLWVSLQLADAVARDDLAKSLGIRQMDRIRALDMESQRHPPKDVKARFHSPEKGYLFLYRDPQGRKHYYEVSTDGRVLLYKRYSRQQKSILELMEDIK